MIDVSKGYPQEVTALELSAATREVIPKTMEAHAPGLGQVAIPTFDGRTVRLTEMSPAVQKLLPKTIGNAVLSQTVVPCCRKS